MVLTFRINSQEGPGHLILCVRERDRGRETDSTVTYCRPHEGAGHLILCVCVCVWCKTRGSPIQWDERQATAITKSVDFKTCQEPTCKRYEMMTNWGCGGMAPQFLTLVLGAGEWSASRPGRFTTRKIASDDHWIGGWVGHKAGPQVVEKSHNFPLTDSRSSSPVTAAVLLLVMMAGN
jgi:hypothetical protein